MFSRSLRMLSFQGGRRMMSSVPPEQEVNKVIRATAWTKAKNYIHKNRQGLLNLVGMYLVFMCCLHNYRVSNAWKDKQQEVDDLEGEVKAIKNALSNETWIQSVEKKVRASKGPVLLDEVALLLKDVSPDKVAPADGSKIDESTASNSSSIAPAPKVTPTPNPIAPASKIGESGSSSRKII